MFIIDLTVRLQGCAPRPAEEANGLTSIYVDDLAQQSVLKIVRDNRVCAVHGVDTVAEKGRPFQLSDLISSSLFPYFQSLIFPFIDISEYALSARAHNYVI